ncbi:MAG: YidC/Oxa1 family rane protein insertase [Actinomycetota bacterium]|nr:preprotein translocase subunit YidC [Cryptosporangiaceae bacterium]MDQ1677278.1 YidC/Oxa1 family rane protein insertase [Actinomycetota bacterium]
MSDLNLNWIYIAISWILLRWHDLWSVVLGGNSGLGWVLSIVFLVITVRIILFPVFVKQIKSQRAMQTLQPQVKALQEKYKGDRESLQREMMELYRREKANPLMGCLPIFLQIPVFIGLFHVLRIIDPTKPKYFKAMTEEYFWKPVEYTGAAAAKIFGAPITAQFGDTASRLKDLGASSPGAVKTVAAVLIATMVITTYVTQRQMISRTGPAADPQQAMIQKLMLYGVPASLLVSGALFPIGVVIYWVTTNLFSMGQQFYVLKKMPPPGGVQADKDKVPADAKALAPKPGVKPQNPKKGARPAASAAPAAATTTATATDDSAPATEGEAAVPARRATGGAASGGTAATRRPAKAGAKKRKGGRR